MKKWIALLMSLTMIVACTAALAEDASLQKVLDKGEFVLGLDDAFPPMGLPRRERRDRGLRHRRGGGGFKAPGR